MIISGSYTLKWGEYAYLNSYISYKLTADFVVTVTAIALRTSYSMYWTWKGKYRIQTFIVKSWHTLAALFVLHFILSFKQWRCIRNVRLQTCFKVIEHGVTGDQFLYRFTNKPALLSLLSNLILLTFSIKELSRFR